MKLVTTKFKSSGNLESWEPTQHLLLDTGKPRKTCVEVAFTFFLFFKLSEPNCRLGLAIDSDVRDGNTGPN